jgi:hypothetical protein
MATDPDFQVIVGSKESFEEQLKVAVREGWEKWGEWAFTIVKGNSHLRCR